METIKYTIYKLIDPTDNQIRYIGLTFNNLNLRLKSHLSEPGKSHKIFWIKKLKKQGLRPIIEAVEENISTHEEACLREIYHIEYHKSIGCDLTNMATGGDKNKKMSDETRKKMSESAKNRKIKTKLSEETKDFLRKKANDRFKDPNERERLRIANKKYEDSKTPEQKLQDILAQNSKSVYQYDKDMNLIAIFPSIKNVEKITGLASVNISRCCKHKVVYVGGYIWRFEGDITPPEYKNRKVIIQYDMNMNFISEFENRRKASLSTGINDSTIRSCCLGKSKSAGGFIWKYK